MFVVLAILLQVALALLMLALFSGQRDHVTNAGSLNCTGLMEACATVCSAEAPAEGVSVVFLLGIYAAAKWSARLISSVFPTTLRNSDWYICADICACALAWIPNPPHPLPLHLGHPKPSVRPHHGGCGSSAEAAVCVDFGKVADRVLRKGSLLQVLSVRNTEHGSLGSASVGLATFALGLHCSLGLATAELVQGFGQDGYNL